MIRQRNDKQTQVMTGQTTTINIDIKVTLYQVPTSIYRYHLLKCLFIGEGEL